MSRSTRHVGVRELRQNLSVYLRRVRAGQTLEVTERGRPVAILAPLPEPDSVLSRLIVSGRATAPVGDLCDLPAPRRHRRRRGSISLSQALEETRADRL
ncbi:MAG TPA: type II toxin-antitoxin system prevent-host-death family antitoxin [Thermoanaerobaculia bacterium]|jgi:prevent-host-death family protein|nr:type II toxin-antitoxin system prevent-host-death family antitoxin [Thermoanaerobaculia bacterium]